MAHTNFQHEHLRLSEGSIRLVQIHGSSTKTAPLSLRITQFATSKRPTYAAISYTWGSAGKLYPITINGKSFQIRPNLWHLLSHLRQRGESRFLFVDALCINQANITERNFHVQFMSRIYEEAELTIVWLGLPSDDRREARAIEFVAEIASHRPGKTAGASFRDLYLTEKAHVRWLNLLSLCRCSYWTRVWIVQEVVKAKRIEVCCGIAQLDWKAFDTVHSIIKSLVCSNTPSSSTSLPAPLSNAIRDILSTIPSRLTARRLSHTASILEDLLLEFHDAQCALPRDKVYGMLGIASDCGYSPTTHTTRGPEPDYSKHIVQVYFDVLKYFRDTSATSSVALLTVLLLRKSLGISSATILHYLRTCTPESLDTTIKQTTLNLKPDYISSISATISNYTSSSDLRQKLTQFDWSPYVGFEIVRPRTPTPSQTTNPKSATDKRKSRASLSNQSSSSSSRLSLTTIPSTSTLTPPTQSHRRNSSTTLSPANHPIIPHTTRPDPKHNNISLNLTSPLHNQPSPPSTTNFHIPFSIPEHNTHPAVDIENLTLSSQKPTLILESSPLTSPLRLGFAPPNTRRGDLLLQFHGLNITLIARRVNNSSALQFIGRAVMITHSGLVSNITSTSTSPRSFAREDGVHAACSYGRGDDISGRGELISPCLIVNNSDGDASTEGIDLERTFWEEQYREHVKHLEDVEIETDALSLYEMLKGV